MVEVKSTGGACPVRGGRRSARAGVDPGGRSAWLWQLLEVLFLLLQFSQ